MLPYKWDATRKCGQMGTPVAHFKNDCEILWLSYFARNQIIIIDRSNKAKLLDSSKFKPINEYYDHNGIALQTITLKDKLMVQNFLRNKN